MTSISVPRLALPESTIPPGTDIYLSHSNDGVMDYCARKFEFQHIYKKIPPVEQRAPEPEAFKVGTVLHETAQAWLRARLQKPDDSQFALDAAFYTLALWWDYRRSDREESLRPLGAVAQVIENMSKDSFWDDWDVAHIDGYGPAIEVPFRIRHISPDIPRGFNIFTQGKADALLIHKKTGEFRTLDFKSTTQPKNTWEPLYRFSDQAPIYDIPLKTVLGIPLGKTKCTYYMLSLSRDTELVEDAHDSTELHVKTDDFLTAEAVTFEYSESDIAEMLEEKNQRVQTLIQYLRRQHFPRRTHGCVMYNYPCAFFKQCHSRDHESLRKWFAFEQWEEKSRIYEPLWTFESPVELNE